MLNIFIGAGASVDFGMPLVNSFTVTFKKNILSRLDTHLFNFHGSIEIKQKFTDMINSDQHYENIIKSLELWMLSEKGEQRQILNTLIEQAVECIHILLLEIQSKSIIKMNQRFKDCVGIKLMLKQNNIVNFFSLNHDVITEELCNFHSINYKDGFRRGVSHNYNSLGVFKVATEEDFENKKLDFLDESDTGINILKLHGSLDIFAIEDKKRYLKIDGDSFSKCILLMRLLEQKSAECCKLLQQRGVNELFVYDDSGVLQFFRRSLLSGGHKFSNRFEQVAPSGLFEEFKIKIHSSKELIVIGYGFGDEHVNNVMSSWLEKSQSNMMTIYDPYRHTLPILTKNFESQVKIINAGFIDFLSSFE